MNDHPERTVKPPIRYQDHIMDRTGAVPCSSVGATGGKTDSTDLRDRLAQKKNVILTALKRNREKGMEVVSAGAVVHN